MTEGMKFDEAKPRLELLPPRALIEVGKVLTAGAEKYDDDNWMFVEPHFKRYMGANLRHVLNCIIDEKDSYYSYDEETGCLHLAHAACCLLFILERQLRDINAASEEKRSRKPKPD